MACPALRTVHGIIMIIIIALMSTIQTLLGSFLRMQLIHQCPLENSWQRQSTT